MPGSEGAGAAGEELFQVVAVALQMLSALQDAKVETSDRQRYLAICDIQETLAIGYTRAGGEPIKGICSMCGQSFPEQEYKTTICGGCERGYGPEFEEE
jgi:hypothetical protein